MKHTGAIEVLNGLDLHDPSEAMVDALVRDDMPAFLEAGVEHTVQRETAAAFGKLFSGILHTPRGQYFADGGVDYTARPRPIDFTNERAVVSFHLDGTSVPDDICGRITVASDASHILIRPLTEQDSPSRDFGSERRAVLQRQLAAFACCLVEDGYGKTGWDGARHNGITEGGIFDKSKEADMTISAIFKWWQALDTIDTGRRRSMTAGHRGSEATSGQRSELMTVLVNAVEGCDQLVTVDTPLAGDGTYSEITVWDGGSDHTMWVPASVARGDFTRRILSGAIMQA